MASQFEDLQNCYLKLRRGENGAALATGHRAKDAAGTAEADGAGPSTHTPTRLQLTSNGKHCASALHLISLMVLCCTCAEPWRPGCGQHVVHVVCSTMATSHVLEQ